MIAALIFVLSFVASAQFLLFYTRSVIASSRTFELSENVRQMTGIGEQALQAAQFGLLLQLIELCPGAGNDSMGIRAVQTYFSGLTLMLSLMPQLPAGLLAKAATWVEQERDACAYFAATALDQRMAYSRTLLSSGARS
jgi:hypothetical protein